jgi:hypothetical protein
MALLVVLCGVVTFGMHLFLDTSRTNDLQQEKQHFLKFHTKEVSDK